MIFLADQDDIWMEGKIPQMASELQFAELVVCDAVVVDDALNVLHQSFFALNRSGPGFVRNLIRCGFLGNCLAFRRSLLTVILPFPNDIPMHDWWIGVVCEAFFRVKFIDKPLVLYRRHAINASTAGERSKSSLLQKISYRVSLVFNLFRLYIGKINAK